MCLHRCSDVKACVAKLERKGVGTCPSGRGGEEEPREYGRIQHLFVGSSESPFPTHGSVLLGVDH